MNKFTAREQVGIGMGIVGMFLLVLTVFGVI